MSESYKSKRKSSLSNQESNSSKNWFKNIIHGFGNIIKTKQSEKPVHKDDKIKSKPSAVKYNEENVIINQEPNYQDLFESCKQVSLSEIIYVEKNKKKGQTPILIYNFLDNPIVLSVIEKSLALLVRCLFDEVCVENIQNYFCYLQHSTLLDISNYKVEVQEKSSIADYPVSPGIINNLNSDALGDQNELDLKNHKKSFSSGDELRFNKCSHGYCRSTPDNINQNVQDVNSSKFSLMGGCNKFTFDNYSNIYFNKVAIQKSQSYASLVRRINSKQPFPTYCSISVASMDSTKEQQYENKIAVRKANERFNRILSNVCTVQGDNSCINNSTTHVEPEIYGQGDFTHKNTKSNYYYSNQKNSPICSFDSSSIFLEYEVQNSLNNQFRSIQRSDYTVNDIKTISSDEDDNLLNIEALPLNKDQNKSDSLDKNFNSNNDKGLSVILQNKIKHFASLTTNSDYPIWGFGNMGSVSTKFTGINSRSSYSEFLKKNIVNCRSILQNSPQRNCHPIVCTDFCFSFNDKNGMVKKNCDSDYGPSFLKPTIASQLKVKEKSKNYFKYKSTL